MTNDWHFHISDCVESQPTCSVVLRYLVFVVRLIASFLNRSLNISYRCKQC